MRFFDASAITAAVSMADMLDAVEAAYRDVAAGRDRSPVRTRVELPGGDLLLMPGIRTAGSGSTVKLVTFMPGNAGRGRPTVQSIIVWFDAASGEPLAVLDGATVTGMRTGAASGVGTRLLARPDAAVMGLIGCGAQAPWQVRAVLAARPIEELRAYARDGAQRAAFAERMQTELGTQVAVSAVTSAEAAVRGADIVCCATTSSTPVFDAAWLSAGAHVNGVGSFRLDMVELPVELFGRASLVAVDSRDAARAEAGDLAAAVAAGTQREDSYVEIGSVDRDWTATRDRAAITVFKSVGMAIQDVAAAELIVQRAGPAMDAGPSLGS